MTSKQFATAAARRGGLLKFDLAVWRITPDNPEGDEVVHTLYVDPALDVVRIGAAMGAFSEKMRDFGNSETSLEDKARVLGEEMPKVKELIKSCLMADSQILWDEAAPAIDIQLLSNIVAWMLAELSPVDPTERASFSPGSTSTMEPSTGGALPAPLTPPTSP